MVLNLKIVNKGKDRFIERLQKERNRFVDQLLAANRKMGGLGSKLLRLENNVPQEA